MLNLHLHLSLTAVSPVGRIANRTTLYLDGSTSKGVCPSYFRNRPYVQSGLVRIREPCLTIFPAAECLVPVVRKGAGSSVLAKPLKTGGRTSDISSACFYL